MLQNNEELPGKQFNILHTFEFLLLLAKILFAAFFKASSKLLRNYSIMQKL